MEGKSMKKIMGKASLLALIFGCGFFVGLMPKMVLQEQEALKQKSALENQQATALEQRSVKLQEQRTVGQQLREGNVRGAFSTAKEKISNIDFSAKLGMKKTEPKQSLAGTTEGPSRPKKDTPQITEEEKKLSEEVKARKQAAEEEFNKILSEATSEKKVLSFKAGTEKDTPIKKQEDERVKAEQDIKDATKALDNAKRIPAWSTDDKEAKAAKIKKAEEELASAKNNLQNLDDKEKEAANLAKLKSEGEGDLGGSSGFGMFKQDEPAQVQKSTGVFSQEESTTKPQSKEETGLAPIREQEIKIEGLSKEEAAAKVAAEKLAAEQQTKSLEASPNRPTKDTPQLSFTEKKRLEAEADKAVKEMAAKNATTEGKVYTKEETKQMLKEQEAVSEAVKQAKKAEESDAIIKKQETKISDLEEALKDKRIASGGRKDMEDELAKAKETLKTAKKEADTDKSTLQKTIDKFTVKERKNVDDAAKALDTARKSGNPADIKKAEEALIKAQQKLKDKEKTVKIGGAVAGGVGVLAIGGGAIGGLVGGMSSQSNISTPSISAGGGTPGSPGGAGSSVSSVGTVDSSGATPTPIPTDASEEPSGEESTTGEEGAQAEESSEETETGDSETGDVVTDDSDAGADTGDVTTDDTQSDESDTSVEETDTEQAVTDEADTGEEAVADDTETADAEAVTTEEETEAGASADQQDESAGGGDEAAAEDDASVTVDEEASAEE